MYCKNHPSAETRVTCSNCGDPICPDCMIFAPVGAKCPDCARMPKSALVRVKPERLLLTAVAGLGAATLGGLLFGQLLSFVSFFTIIIAFGLGLGIGEAVSWASGRFHGSRLAAWAAACAALSILFTPLLRGLMVYGPTIEAMAYVLAFGGVWKFLWIAAAAFGAWRRNA
ncbi:MAG: hypothetical protein IBX61_02790 [Thermoleophilia bacterium]|nr:hypothetical protein [Thermoleophilia bacterium]